MRVTIRGKGFPNEHTLLETPHATCSFQVLTLSRTKCRALVWKHHRMPDHLEPGIHDRVSPWLRPASVCSQGPGIRVPSIALLTFHGTAFSPPASRRTSGELFR